MIVAATDFSDDAGKALRRAALLAKRNAEPLEVLHVVSRPSLDALQEWAPSGTAERLVEDARRLVQAEAAEPAVAGVPAKARLVVGEVLDELLAAAAGASLLVVGAHGLNPLRDAIVGTTAVRLAGRCAVPMLVVRQAPRAAYRNVLVALDLAPGSAALIEAARRLAPGALLAAAHAYDVPFEGALQRAGVTVPVIEEHRAAAAAKARASIQALAAQAGVEGLSARIERAHPARHVLDAQRSLDADLVVVGKRRRGAVEAALLGSVTRHVLADAPVDVLVAPAPAA